jgi:hypothetical protein
VRRLLVAAALLVAAWAAAASPTAPASATHTIPGDCAVSPGPTTYEASQSRSAYMLGMDLASYNMIVPSDTFFGVPRVEAGARGSRGTSGMPYIPPVLLKATSWIESGTAQGDHTVWWNATGPAKISFDCGHGIMQVTSGMTDPADGPWPSSQQALVATHYLYNIGRGSAILVEKWNSAPEYRPIVGNGDPRLLEDWYFALWSYNGFTGPGANRSNHPLDPRYGSWPRTPFSCGPANDGLGHSYANYPYQELVYGCAAHPPSVSGQQVWSPMNATLPNLNDPRWRDPLSRFPNTSQMDMPTPSPPHIDPTGRPADAALTLLRGSPLLSVSRTAVMGATNAVVLSNPGTGVLAWRAKAQQSWIRIDKEAGVVLGPGVPCAAGQPCDRSTTLTISVNTATAPASGVGQVVIESLVTGQRKTVQVVRDFRMDGMLLRGSGSSVYLMRGGLKHRVPNGQTFEANGFDWNAVISLADATLNGIPNGQPVLDLLGDGYLFKGSPPWVFVTQGGRLRYVTSASVMTSCGYNWDAIHVISNSWLGAMPGGAPLTGPPCPKPSPPTGTLLKGSGSVTYVTQQGIRRFVPNGVTFEALGYRWGDINTLRQGALNMIAEGDPMLNVLSTGNLLKGTAAFTYVTQNSTRRYITSPSAMQQCGYGSDAVRVISDVMLGSIASGANVSGPPCPRLSPPTGALVKGSGAQVYVMQSGQKRYVDGPTFASCGYHLGNVNLIPVSSLNAIATGPPLTGAPCP